MKSYKLIESTRRDLLPLPSDIISVFRNPPSPPLSVSMSRRVLCKYFAHGACLKGEYCEFSHDWGAPSNNICTFYQKGICSFGSRCRYEHVKLSNPGDAISLSSSSSSSIALDGAFSVRSQEELAALHRPLGPLTAPAPNLDDQRQDHSEDGNVLESRNVVPADRPLCSVAAVGNCPRGETCPHIHGDLCPTCSFKDHCCRTQVWDTFRVQSSILHHLHKELAQ